jgi:hypothetical protein
MPLASRPVKPAFRYFSLALALSGCSGAGSAGAPGFGTNTAPEGGTSGAPASLHAVGTAATGTATVDFSGAAKTESVSGVYCKLWVQAPQPFLEVLGTSGDRLSSAEIKLWGFDLSAGESRQESFTASQSTVSINASLVSGSTGFGYFPGTDPTGGSCTTTITALSSDAVAGTFDCNPLPLGSNGGSPESLSLTFACPLQP